MKILIKTKIYDEFNGWDDGQVFRLDNGSLFIQDEYKYSYHYAYRPDAIVYKQDGKLYLRVNGMSESVRVRIIDKYIESEINGDFNGWEGETIFKLTNGQTWVQSSYDYHYHYAYRPSVLIFNDGYSYKMKVDGVENTIQVNRIK